TKRTSLTGAGSGRPDQIQLLQDGHSVVQPDLLDDQAVNDLQNRRSGESHRPAGAGRQGADRHVVERFTGLSATADPLAHHIVAFGDQIGGSAERQVRERRAELGGEGPYFVAATAGGVQRILEADVRCGQFADDTGVEVLAPEFGEPPSDNRLVLLDRHLNVPFYVDN